MQLPPFLTQLQQDGSQKPISAVYHHTNRVIGDGHVLCYFPKDTTTSPPLVLYFIPGNPGQVCALMPSEQLANDIQ
ncbi:hypothetical protein FRB94_008656 [Tulasnella sp. JGI-2019a]|nr:hypothetical protein FRB93_012247 [Tulasnella sp. JGI-2019a]KAG9011372.1 hypothetical protein FRB94_008656 [Tulasnella sp. JGI-2019a]